jgi:hypothetical protein
MVKVGKRDLKVKDARKILVEYNKQYKKEEFGKRNKGGMGVYRMGTAKLEQELKMFKVSRDGKSIKHKTNVKFDYKLPESDKLPPVSKAKKSAPKPKKMKKQTEKDKKDESKGMKGQVKGTTSKSDPKNFEKKKKAPAKGKKKAPAKGKAKVDTNKVFTAKNGRKYKKKANGQVYFIKKS